MMRCRGMLQVWLSSLALLSLLSPGSDAAAAVEKPKAGGNAGESAKAAKQKTIPKGSCISPGGRFVPFPYHGKPPRKSPKGKPQDLSFCRVYKDKTCCGRANSDAAMLSLRMLQHSGEPTDECVQFWEALECSVCHPAIGTQPGPPAICDSFCSRVYEACKTAFFATDPIAKVFMPCSPRDALCSKGVEFAATAFDFCTLAGFDVVNITRASGQQRYCFDGALTAVSTGTPAAGSGVERQKEGDSGAAERGIDWKELWEQWVGEDGGAFLGSNVMWAVAGLVLTAAAVFWRWHALKGRRRRAAVFAARQQQQAAYLKMAKKSPAKKSPAKK